MIPEDPLAPDACGGSTTVTWEITNECGEDESCTATFTVMAAPEIVIILPNDTILAAAMDQQTIDDIFEGWLAEVSFTGGCSAEITDDNTGAPSYCGGSTTVTWTVISDCETDVVGTAIFTVPNIPPDAVDDVASTPENTPVDIDILANDTDCSNSLDTSSVTVIEGPSNGTVETDPLTGMATYSPDQDFTGSVMFTYYVCNEAGLCDTAIVTINISVVNKPPVATDDINTTHENMAVSGWVLTNDYDPDGDVLVVNSTPVSNTSNGTLSLSTDGSYTYTPNSDFTGKDYFEYQVCDTGGLCDTALVTITVFSEPGEDNRPPVAVEDNYVGYLNTTVTGELLPNDYDPDDDNITINTTPVVSPESGTLTINSDGSFTFVPAENFTGMVTFQYRICDDASSSLCDVATVTIDIRGKDKPNTTVGVDDGYIVVKDEELAGNVSENDYDPEGDNQVAFTLVVPPANGSIALSPNGTFEFIPYVGFTGNDQFIYQVCDDGDPVACDKATAYIVIEEAPEDSIPGEEEEQEPCELLIPNGFSPNDDGINDYFKIYCMEDYPNADIEIYNRWGNLVYEKENFGNPDRWGSTDAWWDGRSTNKMTVGREKLPAGTYFYILHLNDGSDPITGFVFLNR
ncbi:MAG: tandem-95 repeat protein [Bacteroidales bacterium]|nr:tandem-95 repeat protein [Bacteroidales bacterium]